MQVGKGQPCSVIRLANPRFIKRTAVLGIRRSIPKLHLRMPNPHSQPAPDSDKTTYDWRKRMPNRHAQCGGGDAQVVCPNPKIDVGVQNNYWCPNAFEERTHFQREVCIPSRPSQYWRLDSQAPSLSLEARLAKSSNVSEAL